MASEGIELFTPTNAVGGRRYAELGVFEEDLLFAAFIDLSFSCSLSDAYSAVDVSDEESDGGNC